MINWEWASLGQWLKDILLNRILYKGMAAKKWELMVPYVDFEYRNSPDKGMQMFYDPPRYSSGYAPPFFKQLASYARNTYA